jgi:hypothetical protein
MQIDRHNYEEYFILYMDNELDSNERRQVEDFVQKHPDLKEELDVLLQYKMVPDSNIVFDGKEELMVHCGYSTISLVNYEEWLISYIDNELTAKQKVEVEQFIAVNARVKKEFEILRQTKLQPEEIIFTDKESLYRREEKVRIISMSWWRVVAAAVFILAISTTAIVMLNKKSSTEEGIVNTSGKKQKPNQQNLGSKNNNEKNEVKLPVIAKTNQQVIIPSVKSPNRNIAIKHNDVINKKLPDNLSIKKDEPVVVDNSQKRSNNLPQPLNSNSNNDALKSDITKNNLPDEITIPKKPLTKDDVTTDLTQTSYTGTNPDENLNQSGGKKSKLRGFLRKVTRTFEKNTNINATDDDERVLIGGLALKLK